MDNTDMVYNRFVNNIQGKINVEHQKVDWFCSSFWMAKAGSHVTIVDQRNIQTSVSERTD